MGVQFPVESLSSFPWNTQLKPDWVTPTHYPNPRITLAVDHAPATQEALRARRIVIADEVQPYGAFYVGSFLDSKGNKLWFCSPVAV